MDDFELSILAKIDAKQKLTTDELDTLVLDRDVIQNINGSDRRWSRSVTSIIKIGERFFSINWEEGLTENQDNSFDEQVPVEVVSKLETIVVAKWVPIESDQR